MERKEAMRCPKCQLILTKASGCDALKCPMCKVDICWATRGIDLIEIFLKLYSKLFFFMQLKGLRWGPNGHGDTSEVNNIIFFKKLTSITL